MEEQARALGGLATRRQVRALLDGTDTGPAFEILLYLPNAATGRVPGRRDQNSTLLSFEFHRTRRPDFNDMFAS